VLIFKQKYVRFDPEPHRGNSLLFIYLLFINPHPANHSITKETQKRMKQLRGINVRHRAVIPLFTCSQNVTHHGI